MFPVCSHESTANRTRNPAGTALVIGNREWQRSAAVSLKGKARCPGANRTGQLTYCQLIIFSDDGKWVSCEYGVAHQSGEGCYRKPCASSAMPSKNSTLGD